MSQTLTDEAYARAALTYLAEPADRWLGRLTRIHGAATVLDAIRADRQLGTADLVPGAPGPGPGPAGPLPGQERPAGRLARPGKAQQAVRAAMERWRVRLPGLPSPGEVLAFREAGIRLVCPGDPEWPGQLADLGDDQPYALWLRGRADLRFNCLRSVAVVGSRAATAYGTYVAAELAASVAARGWAVVSGGAFGIDAAAHRGALAADGVTIAVLAGGVDTPYPPAHAELLGAVAAQGVIVSEWPPGGHVSRLRFLVRNRVIAALATGTLVVEAGERSGAVNTARHARDLHRRLMAVPGPVTSDQSAVCHRVLRDWQGVLVTSAAEVIEGFSPLGAVPFTADQPGSTRQLPGLVSRDELDPDSARVLDAMPGRGGSGTLRLAQRAGVAPETAARCLGKLATVGFVERCDDGWRLRRP